MLQIKKLLFPTDFSACAEWAFTHAAHLAARYEAELHILHVVTSIGEDADSPMAYLDQEDREASLAGLYADLDAGTPGTRPEDRVHVLRVEEKHASEATGILDYARIHDIDLIIMGTHGRRGIGRLLMGSVSEEVMRLSSCPVFTVHAREGQEATPTIRRILLPVDFSEHDRLALTYAKDLAATYDAHLDVLHVVEELALPGIYGIQPIYVQVSGTKKHIEEALRKRVDEASGAPVPYTVHVFDGYPPRDVVDFAEEQSTDLIVIATHGRTGLQRFLMGSVAENVVRMAPCPVFSVKSFGKSLLPESARHTSSATTPESMKA